jgi:hypothetical protein
MNAPTASRMEEMTRKDALRDSGVLVISVWHDDDRPESFRARITFQGDDEQAATSVVSTPEDVIAAVRDWLGLHGR